MECSNHSKNDEFIVKVIKAWTSNKPLAIKAGKDWKNTGIRNNSE